eukprot:UN09542
MIVPVSSAAFNIASGVLYPSPLCSIIRKNKIYHNLMQDHTRQKNIKPGQTKALVLYPLIYSATLTNLIYYIDILILINQIS